MNNSKKAVLELEDGTKYCGESFGYEKSVAGENTAEVYRGGDRLERRKNFADNEQRQVKNLSRLRSGIFLPLTKQKSF